LSAIKPEKNGTGGEIYLPWSLEAIVPQIAEKPLEVLEILGIKGKKSYQSIDYPLY
jgi:hypothetical protein